MEPDLHEAAEEGNLDNFLELCKASVEINPRDREGDTPLHVAAYYGHFAICEWLAQKVTDVNFRSEDGSTPLFYAVLRGHSEIVDLFLKNTNDANPKKEDGETPLHLAALNGNLTICQAIAQKVTDVNFRNEDGVTPLFYAAQEGHTAIVEMFLRETDEPNLKILDGRTPLHVALENNHMAIFHLILEKIKKPENKNPKDNHDHSPLHIAAKEGHFELFKKIMAESGEINPTDKNSQTPEKFAKWNEDLPFMELMKDFKNECDFGWSKITSKEGSVVERDLQKIMYLNDVQLLRKFLINNTVQGSLFFECARVNARGCNPLMTAAEFRSKEVLLIMLNHLTQIALEDKSKRGQISQIIHAPGKSLLSLVMNSEHFGKQIISELVECEGHIHEWDGTAFEDCTFKFVGTNKKSLQCNSIFKERKREEKGHSKTQKTLMFFPIFITYLLKIKSVVFDVGTDSALMTQYAKNISVLFPKDLDSSLTDFQLSGEECLWWTFGPILLTFIINLIQAISFLKVKGPNLPRWAKFVISLLSPFWLLLVSFFGAFEETDRKLNLNLKKKMMKKTDEETEETDKQDDDAKEMINEGKMIEVCIEASLQPILQLYLFFLSILSSKDLYNNCVSLWTIVQVLSFVSSVLSIPRNFTQTYAMNKTGMMSTEAQIVYFLFVLCGVLSRMLSFQLLAFVSGKLWIVFSFIGIHVCLMLALNLIFNKITPQNNKIVKKKACWQHVSGMKDLFVHAMANIYIPWSNGKNEENDVTRQIVVEIIIFLESLGISVFALIDDTAAIQEHEKECLAAIWGLYGCYIAIKAWFFFNLHPWSNLIKNGFKTSILCQRKKTVDKGL